MDKILTVIVPTYNMEKYLHRCLDSLIVKDQSLFNQLEVLVINDGSKDSSSAIAHEYESRFPNTFRVIDKENGNYGSCVNRGLKEATGKYVKVLDADDTFDTANFQKFLKSIQATDSDCVLTDMVQVSEVGGGTKICNFTLPSETRFSLEKLTGENCQKLWMHCVCYRAENLRRINYFQTEGISYTDQEWLFLPMATCKEIEYWPCVLYQYLVGRAGQTIDTAVWERNFWMEIKGLQTMMTERKNCNTYVFNTKYLDERIAIRIKVIYFAFFVLFKTSLNNNLVRDLDIELKDWNPKLWESVSDRSLTSRFFLYKIVKRWRRLGYNSNRLSIRFYRMVIRQIGLVKKMIKNFLFL